MIYELRTYTVKPGTVGDMVKAASTVSRDIRGDNFGKLEGYWSTEIGPLNQVLHMWSFSDFAERAKLRAELAKNPRWGGEYLPLIRPLLIRQDVRFLSKIVGLWQTEAGQPNEVLHIWAYPDLNARAEARGNAMKDPAWQEFLKIGPPLLEEMHSTIMLPAPHSPLK